MIYIVNQKNSRQYKIKYTNNTGCINNISSRNYRIYKPNMYIYIE